MVDLTKVSTENGYTQLNASTMINASLEKVWNAVKDPGEIHRFHPLIERSYMITGNNEIGSKRYCKLKPMGVMEEEVIDRVDMEGFTMQVTNGKMLPPYVFMKGALSIAAVGTTVTKVDFCFSYKLKYGALGRLVDMLLVRPQFKIAPTKYVTGLKEYVERSNA